MIFEMRKTLSVAVLVFFVVPIASAEKERGRGDAHDVIVESFPTPLPNDTPQAQKHIWDFISKRPEQQWFVHYSTKDWRRSFDAFAVALVAKAKKNEMDHESLEKLLKKLPDDPLVQQNPMPERACLPIGAYSTLVGKRKLWVIFCLWEYAVDPEKTVVVEPPKLSGQTGDTQVKTTKLDWDQVGHVMAIAYYADGDVFTFVSCD